MKVPTIVLNNGVEVPLLGLGSYANTGWKMTFSVFQALWAGYSLFDTSTAYQNERDFGRALSLLQWMGQRRRLFLSTKLTNTAQRTLDVPTAFWASQSSMRVKKLDLYLMHWPNPGTFLECWKQMETLYKAGHVRAIGVCNFHIHHLEELLKVATVMPAINQVEIHPLLTQEPLRKFCAEHGIAMEAYTPLARMHPKLMQNERLCELAKKYNKTVPQIILRWDTQHKFIVIPKSSSYKRMKENIHIFDFQLTDTEMDQIDALNENFRVRYDPDNCDFTKL